MARTLLPLLSALGALSLPARNVGAHHSVAGQFDMAKRTTITGTSARSIGSTRTSTSTWMSRTRRAPITTWRLESLPTAMLRKAGLTSEMIKGGGQKVTAVALMARNGTPNLAWLLNLKYEDGHEYTLAGE